MKNINWDKIFEVSRLISNQLFGFLKPEQEEVLNKLLEDIHLNDDDMPSLKTLQKDFKERDLIQTTEYKQKLQSYLVYRRRKRIFVFFGTAASILIAFISIHFFFKQDEPRKEFISLISPEFPVLILDDGSVIQIDTSVSLEHQIDKYVSTQQKILSNQKDSVAYHTIFVPCGTIYSFLLDDGSKVWLNAESEIRYPVKFDSIRKIYLSGEGYFKVQKDSTKPFIVYCGENNKVEVLGTEFNIRNCPGRNRVYTTLIEGSILVSNGLNEKIISPGQQVISQEGELFLRTTDILHVTSWKEGYFSFDDSSLEEIFLILTKWYDFEVEFKNKDKKFNRFKGILPHYQSFDEIMESIAWTGDIKYILLDKKVIII